LLLLDENDDVRKLLRRVLETSGYAVLEAADADAALRLAREHEGAIDLFLLDPSLENANAIDLTAKLRTLRPSVQALYLSGYPAEVLIERNLWRPGQTLLHKPFLPQTLLQAVRGLLDQR
jgi:DNA-binding response OmpR family regulator